MTTRELRVGQARLTFRRVQSSATAAPERERVSAAPFVFQHGMGGSTDQALGYVGDHPARDVVSLSARGHFPSSDLTAEAASFDAFADDVIALADHLGLDRFPVGGISLGAGTAINLATRHPERISALVLCRPAWLDRPLPDFNRAAYLEIADILDRLDVDDSGESADRSIEEAATRYQESSAIYREVASAATSAAVSLVGQIRRPRASVNGLLLRTFPADRPTPTRQSWSAVSVPTLVIGHEGDRFHPYAVATAYAEAIPRARLVTVPSKDEDAQGFARQIEAALDAFLRQL